MGKLREPRFSRRHIDNCRFRSRKDINCNCPIWVDYMVDGQRLRKSTGLNSFEEARDYFAAGPIPIEREEIDEIAVAKAILAIDSFRQAETEDFVYFISSGTSNYSVVKIGVSCNVKIRLADLQASTASQLVVRRIFRGGYELEKTLHKLLEAFNKRGEWFRLSPTLKAVIQRSKAMGLVMEIGNKK